MSQARFGSETNESIDRIVKKSVPKNTSSCKNYIWKTFMDFCNERNYELNGERTLEELALILKDWAINMKKRDGTDFKEGTVKTLWNVTSKLLQEKYYNEYKTTIDPFNSVIFKQARNARDAARKKLQADPTKRKISSVPLSLSQFKSIINMWDENTPEGLQRRFYHIAAVELAWRGGEAVVCLVSFFKIEKNDDPSNDRIEYNPSLSKTSQEGSKSSTESKWLVRNVNDINTCPVRLFEKLLSKRGPNVTTNRLFLRPNRHWKTENDNWFDNMPLGKNTINGWTKSAAQAIGVNTKTTKITNHSNRSTAVCQLAKSGAKEQQLLKITGHHNANSLKPYLNLEQEDTSSKLDNKVDETRDEVDDDDTLSHKSFDHLDIKSEVVEFVAEDPLLVEPSCSYTDFEDSEYSSSTVVIKTEGDESDLDLKGKQYAEDLKSLLPEQRNIVTKVLDTIRCKAKRNMLSSEYFQELFSS